MRTTSCTYSADHTPCQSARRCKQQCILSSNRLATWASKSPLKKSQDFTSATQFTAHQKTPITVNRKTLTLRKTHKDLGAKLDQALSFRSHFLTIKESCANRVYPPNGCGCDRITRRQVFDAMICCRLFYGIMLPAERRIS